MKIAVFGASGKTGIEVVKQALKMDYQVKAFVRDPEKLAIRDPKIEIVKGDILNPETIDRAVDGVDVVILALGSMEPVLAKGTKNIIDSMKKYGIMRIIVESSYDFSGSQKGIDRLKSLGMTDAQIESFMPLLNDKKDQEQQVRESGFDYVIVRPLTLTEEERIGKYKVDEKLEVDADSHISRADVADFMLNALHDDKWLHKTVTISY